MATREILTPQQVAEYLQLDEATVYRYIREGKLMASKLGRQYRIPRENVELLLMASATPRTAQLRRYGRQRIEEFLKEDAVDKKHLLTEALRGAGLPLTILSPGEFVRDYYHLHDDYPSSLPPRRGES